MSKSWLTTLVLTHTWLPLFQDVKEQRIAWSVKEEAPCSESGILGVCRRICSSLLLCVDSVLWLEAWCRWHFDKMNSLRVAVSERSSRPKSWHAVVCLTVVFQSVFTTQSVTSCFLSWAGEIKLTNGENVLNVDNIRVVCWNALKPNN